MVIRYHGSYRLLQKPELHVAEKKKAGFHWIQRLWSSYRDLFDADTRDYGRIRLTIYGLHWTGLPPWISVDITQYLTGVFLGLTTLA